MRGAIEYKGRMRVIAALLTLLLAACATERKQTCAQRDWFELGRRDGSRGAPNERLATYKQECKGEFSTGWETIYLNGRNAGLVEYCSTENGFELGRMGLSYLYVCPSMMERDFLTAYRKGQQTRVLQLKRKDLDAQIESLTEQLLTTNAGTDQSEQLREELNHLRQARSEAERDLNRVTR